MLLSLKLSTIVFHFVYNFTVY